MRRRFPTSTVLFAILAACAPATPQSLQKDAPARLAAGVNRGTLDSSGGDQYWEVTLDPGTFRLVLSNDSPVQMFRIGHEPKVTFTLLPEPDGQTAVVKQRSIPGGGSVLEGSVAHRTHVLISVSPAKSEPRETLVYTLVARGNVDFGS